MAMWIGKKRVQDIGDANEVKLESGNFYIDNVAVTLSADTLNDLENIASTIDEISATELGFLDGVTAGTVTVSKAVVAGTSGEVDSLGVQKEFVLAYNDSGSTISKGDLVTFVGAHTNGQSKIVLADANVADRPAEGAVQADILTAASGVVIIRGLSPATLNTNSVSSAGDPAFLSETPGGPTYSEETESDERSQRVGYVVVKSATVGQIYYNFRVAKVGTDAIQSDAVTNALLAPSAVKTYKFTYSFAVLGGAQGALTLTAADGQLPDNFCIDRVYQHTKTAVGSGGAATIKLGITGNDDCFIAATAYTDNKFVVNDQCTVHSNENPLITSAAVDVLATVADADLNAGIFEIWITGFEGL